MNLKPLSFTSMADVALGRTSIGSPSSRLAWQTLELAGSPGNCQFGVGLLTNGSPIASAVSCESAVTSSNPAPKSPGEIQLANWVTQRDCGNTPSRKNVWKPRTQHPPGVLGLAVFRLKRKVLGNIVVFKPLVVKLPRLISFTTTLLKKKLKSGLSIKTNVLPSAAVPVKYDRAVTMVPLANWIFTVNGTVMVTLLLTLGISSVCQLFFMMLKNW